jgi:hypothetical protein
LADVKRRGKLGLKGDIEKSLAPAKHAYCTAHPFIVDEKGTEDAIWRGLFQCSESEARAWPYASSKAAGVPPESVFHSKVYNGDGHILIVMLAHRAHFGAHGLQAAGMTTVETCPAKSRWLQVRFHRSARTRFDDRDQSARVRHKHESGLLPNSIFGERPSLLSNRCPSPNDRAAQSGRSP